MYDVESRWVTATANAGPLGTPAATSPAVRAASPTPTLPGTGTIAPNAAAAAAITSTVAYPSEGRSGWMPWTMHHSATAVTISEASLLPNSSIPRAGESVTTRTDAHASLTIFATRARSDGTSTS